MNVQARLIAFYLPQYHPIIENDRWWGKGFTEWSNVANAKPLFKGHIQPQLPSELGFYDLRVPEIREAQADLARNHGIEGFCYWHYWFGNNKRLLERPFNEVLASKKPDFPFCLAWANESWSGIWHGAPDKILIEQTYQGKQDYINHFYNILPALKDRRYIKSDNKNIFIIYQPFKIPELKIFIDTWRELALKEGVSDFHFIGINGKISQMKEYYLDGFVSYSPRWDLLEKNKLEKSVGIFTKDPRKFIRKYLRKPAIYEYDKYVECCMKYNLSENEYPDIVSNWDNTPRSGINGFVLNNSTPELFGILLQHVIRQVQNREFEKRLVFIKSWNEWAEGNFIEPSLRWNRSYLEKIKEIVESK